MIHLPKHNQFQTAQEATYEAYEGNIKAAPAKLRQATKGDYFEFIRGLEANSANPASFAVTVSFEPKSSEYAAYTVREFNEIVGPMIVPTSRRIIGKMIKKFTSYRTLDSRRAKSHLPFWLLGERYSKHGLEEVRLHLHGRLFFAGDEFMCFARRQAEFENYASQEFEKAICPVSIMIKRDYGNFENYAAKHLSKDVRATEWLITNLK